VKSQSLNMIENARIKLQRILSVISIINQESECEN